ncbi:DUF4436 domain-containing protein [Mycobacterium bourgelatii]|nr:DUF4436 domain-containing protein [Mycobacterium bourgelatii]
MPQAPPPPPESAPTPQSQPQSRRRRVLVTAGLLLTFLVVYALSLVGVHLLGRSGLPLPPVDISKYAADDTIVQLRLGELKPVADRLSVSVLVYPKESLYDKNFGDLTTDAVVRLYPANDLGDLQYPVGKVPGQVATSIEARGTPANWPFDSYATDVISADVFTGQGADRRVDTARVEVVGALDGWDATVTRVHDPDNPDPDSRDNVVITLHRAKGTLIFDAGICLVLVALPALALWVAIPMVSGRAAFLPPFATWFAAMLFAIVPLRNFLPGSPPQGSWIDQALVLWVLIALVVAMFLYVLAWHRDRKKKT